MTTTRMQIAIDQLVESPFNPRKVFHQASLIELSNSMRQVGQLQPLMVRPQQQLDVEGERYEIVFGHRRFRAAKLADLVTLDCDVRNMTDAEAARAQIAENLQRDDVHAIEEAEGMGALIREHGMTVDQVVAQTGKSRTYVYNRLKLLEAVPELRQQCLDGRFGAEVLQLFARIPEALQLKAMAAVEREWQLTFDDDDSDRQASLSQRKVTDGGALSYRRVRELLVEKFALELKGALWKLDDAELLVEAGACTTCPKRSGNAPEVFADVVDGRESWHAKVGANVCTDPDCFAAKKKAHLARTAAELEAKGATVLNGNKAKAALSADGQVRGAYVALADVKAAIKGKGVDVVKIVDQRSGKVVQAVARAAVEAAGVKVAAPKAKSSSRYDPEKWERERQAAQAKVDAERTRRLQVLEQILDVAIARERSAFDLRLVAEAALAGLSFHDVPAVQHLTGLDLQRHADRGASLAKLSAGELTRVVLACALVRDSMPDWIDDVRKVPQHLQAAAQHYGISLPPPEKAARAPAEAPAKGKRKAAIAAVEGDVDAEVAA